VVFLFNNSNLTDDDGQMVVLPSITSHSLRHTFANILCENNVNIKVIQKLMGQSDIETTMKMYTEVSERMAFEEYKRKLQQKKRRRGA
jgi:site-specific recombinase XerD